jgi:hypothetical protein
LKYLFLFILVIALVACANHIPVSTQVSIPLPTPIPTMKPTSIPTRISTLTQSKNTVTTYTLEIGVCIDFREIEGDPKDIGCTPIQRKQIVFVEGNNAVTLSSDSFIGSSPLALYCALYDLKGKLVDSQITKKGSGVVTCSIEGVK